MAEKPKPPHHIAPVDVSSSEGKVVHAVNVGRESGFGMVVILSAVEREDVFPELYGSAADADDKPRRATG